MATVCRSCGESVESLRSHDCPESHPDEAAFVEALGPHRLPGGEHIGPAIEARLLEGFGLSVEEALRCCPRVTTVEQLFRELREGRTDARDEAPEAAPKPTSIFEPGEGLISVSASDIDRAIASAERTGREADEGVPDDGGAGEEALPAGTN